MREINECTAEVFRRSEKRIKERKRNRNRILATCIPLCLILTVFSFAMLPGMLPVGNDDAAEGDVNDFVQAGNESIVCTYVQVEIRNVGLNSEYYKKVTDKVEVTQIFNAVGVLFPDKAPVGPGEEPGDAAEDNGVSDSQSKHSGYVITFSDAEGNHTIYNLGGNELVNVNTDEAVTLTDEQVADLKVALGLID